MGVSPLYFSDICFYFKIDRQLILSKIWIALFLFYDSLKSRINNSSRYDHLRFYTDADLLITARTGCDTSADISNWPNSNNLHIIFYIH